MFETGEPTSSPDLTIETLVELARRWSDLSVGDCDDETLLDAAVGLERVVSLVSVASAHVLAELRVRGTCDARYGHHAQTWVAAQAGCSVGGVRRRLRIGDRLRRDLDVIDDAVVRGSVSFDHAATLTSMANPRVADVISSIQDEIVTMADATTFDRWKADVAALVELVDVDGAAPSDVSLNHASVAITLDGTTRLDATFDADVGAGVRSAIEARADELFRRLTRDNEETAGELDVPERSVLRALAIAELLRNGLGARANQPVAELSLVFFGDEITDRDGHALSEPAAHLAACDADLWALVIDSFGEPLDVGHVRRLATPAMRRAMAIRDGGCVFPGCDAPVEWADAHHVRHWLDGGRTAVENLASLCRHHHGVTHRRGWTMGVTDDQWFWWDTPSGQRLWSQRHHRRRAGPDDP